MAKQEHKKIAVFIVAAVLALATASFALTKIKQHLASAADETQRLEAAKKLVAKTTADIQVSDTGRYVRKVSKHTDPWGTELKISFETGEVTDNAEVRCAGPDKDFGTEDDIVDYRTRASLSVATGTVSQEVKRQFKGIFSKEE